MWVRAVGGESALPPTARYRSEICDLCRAINDEPTFWQDRSMGGCKCAARCDANEAAGARAASEGKAAGAKEEAEAAKEAEERESCRRQR